MKKHLMPYLAAVPSHNVCRRPLFLRTLRQKLIPVFCTPPLLCLPPEFMSNCSLSGCQENCAVTPGGSACYCKSGYEISPDGKTCKGEFFKQWPPSGPP